MPTLSDMMLPMALMRASAQMFQPGPTGRNLTQGMLGGMQQYNALQQQQQQDEMEQQRMTMLMEKYNREKKAYEDAQGLGQQMITKAPYGTESEELGMSVPLGEFSPMDMAKMGDTSQLMGLMAPHMARTGDLDNLLKMLMAEPGKTIPTKYGDISEKYAHNYIPGLKEQDSTTKTINSWSEALFGVGWAGLDQQQKAQVMDKVGVQIPSYIRQQGPPYFSFQATSEGMVPANARTGQMGAPSGYNKPMSNEMITANQQAITLKDAVNQTKMLYDPAYVGPIAGRLGPLGEKTVGVNPLRSKFMSAVAQMSNTLVYLMSGKQINEQEYKRLKQQLPDPSIPPKNFIARMEEFERTMNSIIENRRKLQGGYGIVQGLESPDTGSQAPAGAGGGTDPYLVNKVYPGPNNTKARYLGYGKWETVK